MGRDGFLTVIFLFLIVANPSSAWSFRKLISGKPKDKSSETNISPLPNPVSESKANPIDGGKPGKEQLDDDKNTKGSVNDANNKASANPPPAAWIDDDKNHGEKDGKTSSQSGGNRTCEGSDNRCDVNGTMIACIPSLESGSKDLVLLVQNKGESTLKVNINITTPAKNDPISREISKHQTKMVNISWTIGQNTKIVLKYANETCVLHNGTPPSEWNNFLQRLPSYYKQVTPIYVAYFLFLIALIVGGSWACYKFRKRKRHEGVPYRELEMGLPDSASASNVDTAEGWDEVWDDDWDEDKAVKSPGGRHVGNISANGLTARSTSREGWEKDWDD
ncbi:uncharacterized protein LOC114259265 isoform X2 [Camellia sinensis]|uniref:uncharacterized protein LOC114259265 isoform X2 n=1 Tax=Camellia sinensis TaxID=4442 RepID=UPI001035A259|nr:uncharacterized protein LOC114259265 isoform X2 [Camellia sinensis]